MVTWTYSTEGTLGRDCSKLFRVHASCKPTAELCRTSSSLSSSSSDLSSGRPDLGRRFPDEEEEDGDHKEASALLFGGQTFHMIVYTRS